MWWFFMVFHYPKINARRKWLSENIIILPFMFWMDAEWHDSFGLIDMMYRSISHQNSGHTVVKPRVRGKFMQEFEAWRVKDLESRNKREKAGLQTVQDEEKPVAAPLPLRTTAPAGVVLHARSCQDWGETESSWNSEWASVPAVPADDADGLWKGCVPCHWSRLSWNMAIANPRSKWRCYMGKMMENGDVWSIYSYSYSDIFRYYLYR